MARNLLLAAVTFVLMLIMAEAGLRLVYDVPAIWIDPQTRHLESPLLGWVLPPKSQSFALDAPVSVNSLGLRDDEFPRAKPPGELRILGLGDSFTFGLGVRSEDLYLEILEDRLNAQCAPPAFQVINAGVAGYNTRQELIYLLTDGQSLEPDLITLGFYWNDLLGNAEPLPDLSSTPRVRPDRRMWEVAERQQRHLIPRAIRDRLRQSLVLYLGVGAVKKLFAGAGSNPYADAQRALLEGREAVLAPLWKATGMRLLEIAGAARRAAIPIVLVVFPMENQIRHDYPELVFTERLRSIWEPTGMPMIDLEPRYRASLEAGENPFLPYDLHPNAVGMRIAAEALFGTLVGERLIPLQCRP